MVQKKDRDPGHCCLCLSLFLTVILMLSRPADSSCNVNQAKCGDVPIPYPFSLNGSSNGPCEYPQVFTLECRPNASVGFSEYLYYSGGAGASYQVIEISYNSLILNVSDFKLYEVLSSTNSSQCDQATNGSIVLPSYPAPFTFSADNQFGLFNSTCHTKGQFSINFYDGYSQEDDLEYKSIYQYGGCISHVGCKGDVSVETEVRLQDPSCTTPVTADSRSLFYWTDGTGKDAPCNGYTIPFYPSWSFTDFADTVPIKVLWALPYNTSNNTKTIEQDPLHTCSDYSNVTIQPTIPGYVCQCIPGFKGDGYANGTGCADINECSTRENSCDPHLAICKNTLGSYTCSCKIGYRGDGSRCTISTVLVVFSSLTGSSVVAGILALFLVFAWKRGQKRKNFHQNGGLELQEFVSGTTRDTCRVFTIDELKAATQNFSNHLKLGAGGHGSVFKGICKDGTIVAVKRENRPGENDSYQFRNEMCILTQINHRHIVQVLGCCLEDSSPLLVYEYVSNGTLFDHLQKPPGAGAILDWPKRLQIAIQTAEALAYLHSAASPPILHRDVKSSNILLDDNLDAKVADFGISRPIPEGATHVSTLVQGTFGYLDPEYFQMVQLTEKSDVYSLGVVLTELVTGLKPVDKDRKPELASLAVLFAYKVREGCMEEIMDLRMLMKPQGRRKPEEVNMIMASMEAMGRLAMRCLAMQGRDRPSMRETAEELRNLRSTFGNPD